MKLMSIAINDGPANVAVRATMHRAMKGRKHIAQSLGDEKCLPVVKIKGAVHLLPIERLLHKLVHGLKQFKNRWLDLFPLPENGFLYMQRVVGNAHRFYAFDLSECHIKVFGISILRRTKPLAALVQSPIDVMFIARYPDDIFHVLNCN